MSYLWHLDGLSMALGIGELDGCTRSWNTKCHSIFFWTRIIRITRMFFGTWISLFALDVWTRDFFLNTNFTNKTNVFWHTDLTDLTDLEPSARCEWQLVVVVDSLWLLTRCGYWLVVVIDSLWLLTHCGCWLIVVIGLLWLLTCYVLNDKSKKISVSHAKHWQIREWDPCAK